MVNYQIPMGKEEEGHFRGQVVFSNWGGGFICGGDTAQVG